MSTYQFLKEFSLLLCRWTKDPVTNKYDSDAPEPLSKLQIIRMVKTVMAVILGVELEEKPLPEIPRRFGSMEYLSTSYDSSNVFTMDRLELPSSSDEKKFMSRSQPNIQAWFTEKLDAALRVQAKKDALKKAAEEEVAKGTSRVFQFRVGILKQCADDIMTNVKELTKIMNPETSSPIRRRLPAIPAYARTAPPPRFQRSPTGIPGTKKLDTTIKLEREKASARRQTPLAAKGIYSSSAGSSPKKLATTPKIPKNPRYAHVRSTIPKPGPPRK